MFRDGREESGSNYKPDPCNFELPFNIPPNFDPPRCKSQSYGSVFGTTKKLSDGYTKRTP